MAKPKKTYIVTKSSLHNMIEQADAAKRAHIIGRACVVLFNRQTEDEKSSDETRHDNMRGFTSSDAHSGSLTAKSYLKNRKLADWQVERWTKRNVKGTMRIAKYWRQLDEAAKEKAAIHNQVKYRPVINLKVTKETTVEDIMGPVIKKGTIVPLIEETCAVFA